LQRGKLQRGKLQRGKSQRVYICPFLTILGNDQQKNPHRLFSIPLANTCFFGIILFEKHE